MVALYQHLTVQSGLSPHSAWRAAFAMVPVPALISLAILVLVFGTDHPAGKWEDRHRPLMEAGVEGAGPGTEQHFSHKDEKILISEEAEVEGAKTRIVAVESTRSECRDFSEFLRVLGAVIQRLYSECAVTSEVDVAVNTPLTRQLAYAIITNPLTWLPALSYLTTFGFELAIDSNLANILFAIYKSKSFGQTKAGYITSTFGLLNFIFRPAGGFFGDMMYRRWGVPGKKYLMLACGVMQGALSIGLGFYIDSTGKPDLATVTALVCLVALFNEMANGANFSLVPHINAC